MALVTRDRLGMSMGMHMGMYLGMYLRMVVQPEVEERDVHMPEHQTDPARLERAKTWLGLGVGVGVRGRCKG